MSALGRASTLPRIVIVTLGAVIALAAFLHGSDRASPKLAVASEAGISPAEMMISGPTTNMQVDETVAWTAEVDPRTFDRVALESWWKSYSKKRAAR